MIFHRRWIPLFVLASPLVAASPASGHQPQSGDRVVEHDDHELRGGHPGDAAAVDRTVYVTAREFTFTPDHLIVSSGETIRFVVTNQGQQAHEFVIATASEHHEHEELMRKMDDPGMMESEPNGVALTPGDTKTLVWTFQRAKHLQFACDIPGHYESGMHGDVRFVR